MAINNRGYLILNLERLALAIAFIFMVPFFYLASSVFFPFGDNWTHIIDTVLLDYFVNSLSLAVGVGFLTFIIGTSTAWLTSIYEFPFILSQTGDDLSTRKIEFIINPKAITPI